MNLLFETVESDRVGVSFFGGTSCVDTEWVGSMMGFGADEKYSRIMDWMASL
jgi:hypothetical protein